MPTHNPLVLTNARLVDPASGKQGRGSVWVEEGNIKDVLWDVPNPGLPDGAFALDCQGDIVCPGLIDMRAFVGEPGAEHRETIEGATQAAAAGGITTLLAMPETHPAIDDPAVVDFVLHRVRDTALVRVLPAAALTRGLEGREIAELGLLQGAGAVAFTDGAHCVQNALVMRRALTYARDFDALVIHQPEDRNLKGEGVMNEGEFATRLGMVGVPSEAESIMLERDITLVALTGARYHAAMISCRASLDLVRRAKERGLPVTCGVSINHLTLNENDIGDYRTYFKFSPPLRDEDERLALVEGLAEGLIDIIVSDHNPQDVETKRLPFAAAADGAIGLETLLSAALRLVNGGHLSLPRLLKALCSNPAQILRLPQGRLQKGAPADLIRLDPEEPWLVDPAKLRSRCKNTPFEDARLEGRVKMTMVAGRIVLQ